MAPHAVVFDFYGTLAIRHGAAPSLRSILAEHGYDPDDDLIWEYFNDGIDGTTHHEHSQSRDHYRAWQRTRFVDLMGRLGVAEHHHDPVESRLQAGWSAGAMVAYPEADAVLAELRRRGVPVWICSNWDWDLREAVTQTGLHDHVDEMVSSAWVGARKPHPHIYEHVLRAAAVEPEQVLFVGDTWSCDVVGPAEHGMTPVYVRRPDREPDHTRPAGATTAHEHPDLRGLLDLV